MQEIEDLNAKSPSSHELEERQRSIDMAETARIAADERARVAHDRVVALEDEIDTMQEVAARAGSDPDGAAIKSGDRSTGVAEHGWADRSSTPSQDAGRRGTNSGGYRCRAATPSCTRYGRNWDQLTRRLEETQRDDEVEPQPCVNRSWSSNPPPSPPRNMSPRSRKGIARSRADRDTELPVQTRCRACRDASGGR